LNVECLNRIPINLFGKRLERNDNYKIDVSRVMLAFILFESLVPTEE